jgi:peptidoglycan LD-endopeptidase CwlK
MSFNLTIRDQERMEGLHPDLVYVVKDAAKLTDMPFMVVEGLRTLETQKKYLKNGVTKTLKSRHLHGCAIDLAAIKDGIVVYKFKNSEQRRLQKRLNDVMKLAASDLGIPLKFGGDWGWDFFHWELPTEHYPDDWAVNKS